MNSEQLIEYITQVMEEIFQDILSAGDLLKDKNKTALLNAIYDALDRLGLTIDDVIPQQTLLSYFSGVDEASKLMTEAGIAIEGGLALTASGQVAKGFRRRIHLEAVQAIVDDTLMDLQAAIRTAKKSVKVTIETTLKDVKTDIVKGLIKGDPNKVVSQKVSKSFAENGLTSFVTSDGKKLPLDFYARTVTKTKMKDANVTGAQNRYLENDVSLVQIDEHQPTCKVCAKYGGMVVSLTGDDEGFKSAKDDDIKLPPYHPNCEHSIRPFVIDFKSKKEIQAEKAKWKKWSPEKDTRSPAQKKAYEKEQSIRRQANEEKKQYARWSAILGDDNFKTLGAFRRAKRENSIRFQELQDQYRSTMREIKNPKPKNDPPAKSTKKTEPKQPTPKQTKGNVMDRFVKVSDDWDY